MRLTANCCLNLPPPTTSSNKPSLINPPHQTSLGAKNERCWRRQFILIGVTSFCTIIGLQFMCNNSVTLAQEFYTKKEELVNGRAKWSEKRACPSWRVNSLETIVPENLPRPAARRRYEAVGSTSKAAPPPLTVPEKATRNKGGCFSM